MSVKFANNAHSTLASSISTSATSITVASGQGARFPSLSSGEYFYATLIDTSNNLEIIKVTGRSTDVLTATRAQEGTTARAFASGDRIELRVTAQGLVDATSLDAVVADDSITAAKINVSGNGTAGQALLTDGDGSFSYGDAGGGLQSIQSFSSSGTYTKPSGIKMIRVFITGGGGGGGAPPGDDQDDSGQGGGGGGTAIEILDATSISTVTVTIGAGGATATGDNNGGDGGSSSFGSFCSATGGKGGYGGNASGQSTRGHGGVGTGGDLNLRGGPGSGWQSNQLYQGAGVGGDTYFGVGGVGAKANQTNFSGSSNQPAQAGQKGGGGGGAAHGATTSGAGGAGFCVVEEYK